MTAYFKKLTSLLFILLGLAPLLAVLVLSIRKQHVRHRMKEKLESQLLQTIVLSESDVTWVKKHEIRIEGRMFDIKTKKLVDGYYTFTGLYDDEETMLEELQKKTSSGQHEQYKLLAYYLKCLPHFFNAITDYSYKAGTSSCISCFVSKDPVTLFQEILTPPPQVC